jgi:hypothetical protein
VHALGDRFRNAVGRMSLLAAHSDLHDAGLFRKQLTNCLSSEVPQLRKIANAIVLFSVVDIEGHSSYHSFLDFVADASSGAEFSSSESIMMLCSGRLRGRNCFWKLHSAETSRFKASSNWRFASRMTVVGGPKCSRWLIANRMRSIATLIWYAISHSVGACSDCR